jgi:hypothetical protein
VNARGAALSLTTDSNADMDSSDDDEEEENVDDFEEGEGQVVKEVAKADWESCSTDDPIHVQQGEVADNTERALRDETENEGFAIVGASGASVEDLWSLDKQKRVLSSNTLSILNRDAGINAEVSKRFRSSPTINTVMPEISLGLAAFDQILPLPRQYLMRGDSPFHSSDEEGDKMLSEELEENPRGGFATSPIPLLTPPQSPRRECVLLDDENTSAVEWPSNLVVDSAMMIAVMDLRPLSPASLQDLEEHEEERLKQADSSSLTPLLRSICVGKI